MKLWINGGIDSSGTAFNTVQIYWKRGNGHAPPTIRLYTHILAIPSPQLFNLPQNATARSDGWLRRLTWPPLICSHHATRNYFAQTSRQACKRSTKTITTERPQQLRSKSSSSALDRPAFLSCTNCKLRDDDRRCQPRGSVTESWFQNCLERIRIVVSGGGVPWQAVSVGIANVIDRRSVEVLTADWSVSMVVKVVTPGCLIPHAPSHYSDTLHA